MANTERGTTHDACPAFRMGCSCYRCLDFYMRHYANSCSYAKPPEPLSDDEIHGWLRQDEAR